MHAGGFLTGHGASSCRAYLAETGPDLPAIPICGPPDIILMVGHLEMAGSTAVAFFAILKYDTVSYMKIVMVGPLPGLGT